MVFSNVFLTASAENQPKKGQSFSQSWALVVRVRAGRPGALVGEGGLPEALVGSWLQVWKSPCVGLQVCDLQSTSYCPHQQRFPQ